jgi:uncharacterized damage-inducible protein DinB
MSMVKAIAQELEMEAQTTARVLALVPEDKLTWKPSEKSMTLGQLALHVATIPGGIAYIAHNPPTSVPEFKQAAAASSAELMGAFEQSLSGARAYLGSLTDGDLGKEWQLTDSGRTVFALPVGGLIRTIMLNHWYHHRGQLSVYLRELGVALPSIYGPSADENPFAAAASARG